MEEIIGLEEKGILRFCDMLVPLGTGDDTKARFAIQSLAVYSGGKKSTIENDLVENTLLQAVESASNEEVKTFLIDRLLYCGTNASVASMSNYLSNDKLYAPALAVLSTIGTPEAKAAIFNAAKTTDNDKKAAFIEVLGKLKYKEATRFLEGLSMSDSVLIQQKSLQALGEIANPKSFNTLLNAAHNANFSTDKTEAVLAFVKYGNNLGENGNLELSTSVGNELFKNCTSQLQLQFRAAALNLLRKNEGNAFTKTLFKEIKNENYAYRGAVLNAASHNLTSSEVSKWVKVYKKASPEAKTQIIRMLSKRNENVVFDNCLLPALNDTNAMVRIAGIKSLAFQNKQIAFPQLMHALKLAVSDDEFLAIKETLLRICDANDSNAVANSIDKVNDKGRMVLVQLLAARRATAQFDKVIPLVNSGSENLKGAVYAALPLLSTSENLSKIITLLNTTENQKHLSSIQQAIIYILDNSSADNSETIYKAFSNMQEKDKILPVLPALGTKEGLDLITASLNSGNNNEKFAALNGLANWRNNDAIPLLFQTASTSSMNDLRSKAFNYYLDQVLKSTYPDDQKLLLTRKLMPYSKSINEKEMIIKSAGSIKTFLSLIFVADYLDTEGLIATASNTIIRIALPTPGKSNGLSGELVRDIVSRSINNLTGPDSQYIKIDVKEFLDNMPKGKGFESIFNGKDFTGWEGLVENPIVRSKMSKNTLKKAQIKANEQMKKDWFVKDGVFGFKGEGYNNICTIKDYGDFEMIVDWKITNGGDSGIYLRGTPQVQIWDIARTDHEDTKFGSGGLFNNQKNERIPLVVADNPIDDWNTFKIKMVGERVTVHLNGILVTDNVVLENYWDKNMSIFPKEAIELQAHGENLGFRNIYVREILSGDDLLSEEEKSNGFKSLFNGKDLNHWIGNKTDYLVDNNEIVVRPKQGNHGNLYSVDEYSDFIFRFEFKLTPGANNGLGIHTPLEGDAAYVGKELQILDDTAAIYADLEPYQYHGSVYGVISPKKGYLKPIGEWNTEEVIIKGDAIQITLNGTVIVDGNMAEASKNGTLDGMDHPGLKRNKGHIAFLGHGSELQFRNIRIKDLSK
jgi:HEAT repeat protein